MAGEEGLEPSHAGIKIRCLDQLGDSPTLTFGTAGRCRPSGNAKTQDAKANKGCSPRLATTTPLISSGSFESAASASASLRNAANTLAPEPVMRAAAFPSNHSSARATSAYFLATTACMSFRPKPSGQSVCTTDPAWLPGFAAALLCCARKSVILIGVESLVKHSSEKIAAVGTCTLGVTTRNQRDGNSTCSNASPIPSANAFFPKIKNGTSAPSLSASACSSARGRFRSDQKSVV